MSYIITFFKTDGRERSYRFPKSPLLTVPQMAHNLMEWVDEQPIAKLLRTNSIPYAFCIEVPSSITVRDLTEDETILLKLAAGTDVRIAHEHDIRRNNKSVQCSTEGTQYARPAAKKDYKIVKRTRESIRQRRR